jgi:hypothetical protein
MTLGLHAYFRRSLAVAAAGILTLTLTACTGRGGGQLPPDGVAFAGPASFGFSVSCEDKGGLNPPTGRLHIELSYTDHGSNPIDSAFGIHGIVDAIDPVMESMACIGDEEAPDGKLIFLGRYRVTSSTPARFPSTCTTREGDSTPSCRFEVIVRDNDRDGIPSTGDYFHIALSSGTALTSEFDPASVFYTRSGLLSSGNLTVD